MSRARIQNGGGSVPSGASYNFRILRTEREMRSRMAATPKPTSGDRSRDLPVLVACPQSTPLVPVLTEMS